MLRTSGTALAFPSNPQWLERTYHLPCLRGLGSLKGLEDTGPPRYLFNGKEIWWEDIMEEIARKVAIAIVMIVPAFVISGLFWAIVESWALVILWQIAMVVIYFSIIKRLLPHSSEKGEHA